MRYSACATIILACVAGCSDSEGPVPPPPPIALSQTIGPAGGTLASTDGRVTLTIPAGALTQSVAITVNELTNPSAPAVPGATYDLGPNGTTFAIPATLMIRYDPSRLRPGTTEAELVLAKQRGASEWEVEKSTVDAGGNRITGEIWSFSNHGAVAHIAVPPPGLTTEYLPNRSINVTPTGTVPGEVILQVAKGTGLAPPPDAAFSQLGSIHAINSVVNYGVDASAGVYWFRARYRYADAQNVNWLGLFTDPPAREIVFGLPDLPDRATSFTATAVDPGAVDLNFTFPSPGPNNGHAGYRIQRFRAGVPNGGVIELGLAPQLPHRDAGLSPDTDYSYNLVAFNERGEGPGIGASVRTPPLPPTACRAYTVALVNPPTSAIRGADVSIDVSVTRLGFNGGITLTLTGNGTEAVENVQLTDPGAGSTGRIQFRVRSAAALGQAGFTLDATSGGEFCPTTFELDVQQPPAPTVSKLTAQPGAVALTPNTSAAIWLGNSGNTPMVLSATTPTGSGLTVSFVPAVITGVAVVIVRAGAQIVPGVHTVTVTGTAPGEIRTVNLEVSLAAVSLFSISMPSPINWQRDQSSSHQGTLNRGPGFPNSVTMTVPDLPPGVSGGFNPGVITADPPVPISLGVHAFPQAGQGLHIIHVTGTAGSEVRAARVLAIVDGQTGVPGALTLIPESRVTLSRVANPAAVDVQVVIARPAALAGAPLTLSVSGLPTGVTAAFVVNPATANTIMTLTAAPNASLGQHQLTLTATGGPQPVTAPIRLTVTGNSL